MPVAATSLAAAPLAAAPLAGTPVAGTPVAANTTGLKKPTGQQKSTHTQQDQPTGHHR
jgi:hypothetical protein